jgi:hypothetical protein
MKTIFFILACLSLVVFGVGIGIAVSAENSLGFGGFLCAAIWVLNFILLLSNTKSKDI